MKEEEERRIKEDEERKIREEEDKIREDEGGFHFFFQPTSSLISNHLNPFILF